MTAQFPPDDESRLPILGRYRREATLGRGGFGEVFRAFDTRFPRTVAIKTLRPDFSSLHRARFLEMETRFEREAEAASRMGVHRNIVTVHDRDRDAGGTLYLIMEYVPGGTLRDRLRPAPDTPGTIVALPRAEALQIAADVARGLHAAHLHRVVHRDVKPANIFLAAEGQAKIGDFGIAQLDDHTIITRESAGHPYTLLYASPEQLVVTTPLGPATDQYSLGLVLFEMLTATPYKDLTDEERANALRRHPSGVAAVVARMTAAEPRARYGSLGEVVAAIEALGPEVRAWEAAETEPGPAPPPVPRPILDRDDQWRTGPAEIVPTPVPAPVPVPTPRPVSRRAVLTGVGGLAAAGGLAGVAWAIGQGGGDRATAMPALPTTVPATIPPTAIPATATPVGTAAVPLAGPTKIWTDPENRLTVRYLGSWQADPSSGVDENGTLMQATAKQPLFTLTGPDSVRLSVIIYDAAGSLDGDLDAFRTLAANDAKTPSTIGPTQDATVGGRPARAVTANYNQNGAAVTAALWMFDNGAKRIVFSGDRIGTHRTEIESILGAVVFMVGSAAAVAASPAATAMSTRAPSPTAATPAATATTAPTARPPTATAGAPTLILWKDLENRISLSYPSDYSSNPNAIFSLNDLELAAPDQSKFFVAISQPATASVQDLLTTYINDWKAGKVRSPQSNTLRFDAPVTTGHLDTEPLSSVHFVYTNPATNDPIEATAWFARHRDFALQMEAYSVPGKAAPTRAATVNAIVNSVKFLT